MTKNEMLNQKVCDKMQAELDKYIAELKTKSSSEIIECAYELIYKEDRDISEIMLLTIDNNGRVFVIPKRSES